MRNYTEINAKAITNWINAEGGWEWNKPVTPEICEKARKGEWDVLLSPTRPVPKDWFLPFKNTKILGLASGGGQQMPIFALQGADCTVMDITEAQLENERMVSKREGYDINIVKGDMTKPFPFTDGQFDLIFHPVSNCYIEDVHHVWRECYRVLRPGGVLISGMDNGMGYIFEDPCSLTVSPLPYNPLKNPTQMANLNPEEESIQFSHTFDDQIGGQLKAGFVLTAAYEDYDNDADMHEILKTIPAFWATRAVKEKGTK